MRTAFILAAALFLVQNLCAQYKPWMWAGGSKDNKVTGIYGEKDVPDANNFPGSREEPITWTDSKGRFYLFGGFGVDAEGNYGPGTLNDIWRWDGKNWTWIKGTKKAGNYNSFGQTGILNKNNFPGFRRFCTYCIDNQGNFWLYGGWGYDARGKTVILDDLWKYNGRNWVRMYKGNYYVDFNDSTGGPGNRLSASMWSDSKGNIWLFGGFQGGRDVNFNGYRNDLWKWDGAQWSFEHGNKAPNGQATYGIKGKYDSLNVPEGVRANAYWKDKKGNFYIYGGYSNKPANNLVWKWNGHAWAWINGVPEKYNQRSKFDSLSKADSNNTPGSRSKMCTWTDRQGHLWVFGGWGFDSTKNVSVRYLNDLWEFRDSTWICHNYYDSTEITAQYGVLGVADSNNRPGARQNMGAWTDKHGDLWLLGGQGYNDTINGVFNDIWYRQLEKPKPRIHVLGNDVFIPNQQMNESYADLTIFDTLLTSSAPARHTFKIKNDGNAPLSLKGIKTTDLNHINSNIFSIRFKDTIRWLLPEDSTEFYVVFTPEKRGTYKSLIQITNNDNEANPFYFSVVGTVLQGGFNVTKTDCSSIRISYRTNLNSEFAVFVSNNPIYTKSLPNTFPQPSFNQSFIKAPAYDSTCKILYLGKDSVFEVNDLVSGRNYYLMLFHFSQIGNDISPDTATIAYRHFSIKKPVWHQKVDILPKIDTGFCYFDNNFALGTSPFKVEWFDGETDKQRQAIPNKKHHFITKDSNNCILSSDSVFISQYSLPVLDSIISTVDTPFCFGDTVVFTGFAKDSFFWETSKKKTIMVSQSSKLHYSIITKNGCIVSDSLESEFFEYPKFPIELDASYNAINGILEIDSTETSFQTKWKSNNRIYSSLSQISFLGTDTLYWIAENYGCEIWQHTIVNNLTSAEQWVPNAFSPNGDGINDTFFVWIKNATPTYLMVFDRWGGTLHAGPNAWDGKKNGEIVSTGNYFFIYWYEKNNTSAKIHGTLSIIKN